MQHTTRRQRGSITAAPLFFFGILAGITVPAYQDYTIRVQVTEGLNLAGAVKASVAEFHAQHGRMPRDLRELKFESAPRGRYVTFVAVNRGVVVIRYGREAATALTGRQLTLDPDVSANGDVHWACGHRQEPGAGVATNIENKYLPRLCRAES